jgi:hypothetical protein
MSWLNDWKEAAEHPWRVFAFMFLAGLVGAGLIGYFQFDRSPVWAAILGVTCGVILTFVGWKSMHERGLGSGAQGSFWTRARKPLIRLAILFGSLAVATIVGAATHSEHLFVAVFAGALALVLALRFTVLR